MFKSIAVFFIVYLPLAVLFSFMPLPEAVARYSLYAYALIAALAAMLAGKVFYRDWQEEATLVQSLIFTLVAFVIVLFGIPVIMAAHFIKALSLEMLIELLREIWQNDGDATFLIKSYLQHLETSEHMRLFINAVVFFVVIWQSFSQTVRRQAN